MAKKIALNICFGNVLVSVLEMCLYQTFLDFAGNNIERKKCETALNVKFTQNLVLFGTEIDIKTDTVFESVILQAKQFI